MKKQLRNVKSKLTRVELTPFPVWKKCYFILMASIGLTSLGVLGCLLLLWIAGVI